MIVDEQFRNYNLYRRAVRRGWVEPLAHSCGSEYVSGYGKDDEFVLNCWNCDAEIVPGLADLERIEDAVRKYFDA